MSRSELLKKARALLHSIPPKEFFEVPGKADVLFELRDYSADTAKGAETARTEIPFLFKPFEVGQKPPPRDSSYSREPTIHEYLDWTVTAATLDSLDFSGFRVLILLPRYRPLWPPPSGDDLCEPVERKYAPLGGPKEPIPYLTPFGRPISATTIRSGPDYIEVPFFATKPSARGKGYGRALLYAIEDICRYLGLSKILLCSTDDSTTISTWLHLGFRHTLSHELPDWGIPPTELVHMTNTVQLVKIVDRVPEWRMLRIKHQGFDQRLYYKPALLSRKKRKDKLREDLTDQNADRSGQVKKQKLIDSPEKEIKNSRVTPEFDRNNIIEQPS